MGVVNEAIENGVGDGSVTDHLVPVLYRKLAGDHRGTIDMAVVHDLEQIAALFVVQGGQPPVVDDEHVGLGQCGEELQVPSLALGLQDLGEQPGSSAVDDVEPVSARLLAESAGEIGLAGPGGADDQDVIVVSRGDMMIFSVLESGRISVPRSPPGSLRQAGRKLHRK